MSPRAACRLEGLGFTRVFDYVDGIADWKAAGLAFAGIADGRERVADATRGDLITCQPEETIGEVRARIATEGWEVCAVVHCDEVVIGRLRPDALQDPVDRLVGEVMEPGPSSVRPDELLQPLVERMEHRNAPHVLVTTPQGNLIGILFRDEAKRLLAGEPPTQIWRDCEGCPGRWAESAD
jgi:CBS domain-containing protein